MTLVTECSYTIEQDKAESLEDKVVVKRDGVLTTVLCHLSQFWPLRLAMRAFRGFWWFFGFSPSDEKVLCAPTEEVVHSSPPRQCLAGRKRLRRATRLLLAILPRRVQRALGYPVCTSIGCSLSPEVRVSPTKPCGKGSKRKQDELDEDEEHEQPTWVEALTQELADEDDVTADPDYETSVSEIESEEFCSHNETESDLELSQAGLVMIEDVKTGVLPEV